MLLSSVKNTLALAYLGLRGKLVLVANPNKPPPLRPLSSTYTTCAAVIYECEEREQENMSEVVREVVYLLPFFPFLWGIIDNFLFSRHLGFGNARQRERERKKTKRLVLLDSREMDDQLLSDF